MSHARQISNFMEHGTFPTTPRMVLGVAGLKGLGLRVSFIDKRCFISWILRRPAKEIMARQTSQSPIPLQSCEMPILVLVLEERNWRP